jgi:hypothetical protein
MNECSRRHLLPLSVAAISLLLPAASLAQDGKAAISLFKIISVKDEIVVGLSADELGQLGGSDAGAIARALVAKGTLTLWQYAVRKAANGDLEQAPSRKVALIAHDSLRVEPFSSPLKILPHE